MLSKKCIDDIKKLECPDWVEQYTPELFERRQEIEEKELQWMKEEDVREILLGEFTDEDWMIDQDLLQEIEQNTKEELIEQILEWQDWWEDEFIHWCVDVYMND